MKSYWQCVGGGCPDAGGPSWLLFFEDQRYLFNCGEGLQRACGEHHLRWSRISTIFLTKLDWECLGGLPGLICTMADALNEQGGIGGGGDTMVEMPVPSLRIVGPPNTAHVLAAMRPFLHRSNFALQVIECTQDGQPCHSDHNISVTAHFQKADPLVQADSQAELAAKKPRLSSLSPAQVLTTMFFQASQSPANINQSEKGPDRQNRDDCPDRHERNYDRYENFLAAISPFPHAIEYRIQAADLPGKFNPLAAKQLGLKPGPLYAKLVKGETIELEDGRIIEPEQVVGPSQPGPLVWYAPHEGGHALFSGADKNKPVTWVGRGLGPNLLASASLLKGLQVLDAQAFPLPWAEKKPDGCCLPLTIYDPLAVSGLDSGRAQELLIQAQDLFVTERTAPPPLLITLGTGAALPGKYRNVSANWLCLDGQHGVLLDCGEGTVGQLQRAGVDPAQVQLVFISHLHADHHIGLPGLLQMKRKGKLALVGPERLSVWLSEYGQASPFACEYDFYPAESLLVEPLVLFGLGLSTVPAIHCPRSFGLIIQSEDCQKKVAFSGDTRPCPALIHAGKGANLLIHEATMPDELAADALAKRHCTVGEAMQVAREMQSEWTVLTHFSQRFAKKVPEISEKGIILAVDLLRIQGWEDLPQAAKLAPRMPSHMPE